MSTIKTPLEDSHNPKKLKIGLLLDDLNVDAWVFKLVENLNYSNFAEINLIVLNDNTKMPQMNKSIISKFVNNKGRIGYLFVRKLLEEVYSRLIERTTYLKNAEDSVCLAPILSNVPTIKIQTNRTDYSDYFSPHDVTAIKAAESDILFRVGFGILRGDILSAARYGVWSFHHGDNTINRGGPAGFWESMESWPETGSVLQILTEDLDNGLILYRSFSCTHSLSVQDNKSNYYWKTQDFLTRKICELYSIGETAFFEKVSHDNRHLSIYSERLYVAPTNLELTKLTIKKILEKVNVLYQNFFYQDQWILMFDLKTEFSSSLWRYKKMIPPSDKFWADPHILFRDGVYYIFIEEYIYETGKGHISLIVMDSNGKYSSPETVLDLPYHLSYPFVFEHEGECFMIPETMDNNSIELYKCTEFPSKWEFQCNLMSNIKAVDTTLHFQDNKWWMFTTILETEGVSSWDELYIYHSSDLFSSDWNAHTQNPVVSDCKRARSAGKLFTKAGVLYRPSQNCSHRYGYGFNLNEVTLLTEEKYEENTVSKIKPNWEKSIVGTHTFNRCENLHIIDAIMRRRKNRLPF